MYKKLSFFLVIFLLLITANTALAAPFSDRNGDGEIKVLAFGDSITYGIGSTHQAGEYVESVGPEKSKGYPEILSEISSIEVMNAGIPGDRLIEGGADRAVRKIKTGLYDAVIILEGANDAMYQESPSDYDIALQKVINVAVLHNTEPILMTGPWPLVNHAGQGSWIGNYNAKVFNAADINELRLVDLESLWFERCTDDEVCDLYNMPEGLHPNLLGYQVMAEYIYDTLSGNN